MSTQKNELYHILSPEWLKTNPLPEDGEFENNDGKWLASSRRGHVTPGWNEYPYRTRRTDLPPEAYITPPTDTTGSGREGEKCPDCNGSGYQNLIGCPGAQGECATCGPARRAAEVIIAGFAANGRKNEDWIAEAASIIRREYSNSALTPEAQLSALAAEVTRLRECLESAVADFRKLKPMIGDSADAIADLYQSYLK